MRAKDPIVTISEDRTLVLASIVKGIGSHTNHREKNGSYNGTLCAVRVRK